jgi:hypothetical protein
MIGPAKLYESSGNFTMQFVGTSDELADVPTGVWIPRLGDRWYDTENGTLKYYDGDSWDRPLPMLNGIDFLGDGGPTGVLSRNSVTETLDYGMPGGTVNQQVGEEFLKRVTNKTGEVIPNGVVVYISGSQGHNITVAPADAEYELGIAFRTYAVTTEEIGINQKGYVTKFGVVRGLDLAIYDEGAALYLAVGGGFTTTPPTSPDVTILVGIVEKATDEDGELDISITSIPNLSSLSDVLITNLQDGQVLQWDNTAKVWKNVTLP